MIAFSQTYQHLPYTYYIQAIILKLIKELSKFLSIVYHIYQAYFIQELYQVYLQNSCNGLYLQFLLNALQIKPLMVIYFLIQLLKVKQVTFFHQNLKEIQHHSFTVFQTFYLILHYLWSAIASFIQFHKPQSSNFNVMQLIAEDLYTFNP